MNIVNTPANPVTPQAGLYQIRNIIRFSDTAKFPVALVNYKRDVSFDVIKDTVFYISLQSLYYNQSSGPKDIFPENLKGKTIHLKAIYDAPEIKDNKLKLVEVTEWEVLDMFKLYDLYKQQGEGILVVSEADMAEYDLMEQLNESENLLIDEAYAQQEVVNADYDMIDTTIPGDDSFTSNATDIE